LHLDYEKTMKMPLNLRKWMIERFIEQKENENKQMEAQKRKASRK
jgi:hypothetical protein